MSGSRKPRERSRGPHRPRPPLRGRNAPTSGRADVDPTEPAAEGVDPPAPPTDVPLASDELPDAAPSSQAARESGDEVSPTRDTRFVSWTDLERVADEAADIDSIVRDELERVGHPHSVPERPPARENGPRRAPRERRRPASSMLLPLIVLAAAIGVVAIVGRDRPTDTGVVAARSPSPRAAAPTTQPPSTSTSMSPSPSPSPNRSSVDGILARLSISDRCWVRAVVDGQPVFTGTLTAGGRTFHADRSLLLTLGNAGGARVEVDGRAITTGGVGEVVDLSFVVRGDRVVQLSA